MMRTVKLLFLVISFFVLGLSLAQAQEAVTVDLADESVDITTGFNGAHLKLFGVRDEPGEIAIVISGPHHDMVVRKKQKFMGIWTNLSGIRFEDVPVYYDYALEKSPSEKEAKALAAHGIGMGALRFDTDEEEPEAQLRLFQDALIRNKQAEGRFPAGPQKITFLSDTFFKTSFYIPANVPTGDYKIQTFLLRNGAVKALRTTDVRVGQVGFSAKIYEFAKDNGVLYGLSCVLFAVFMGWLSDFIRRRV